MVPRRLTRTSVRVIALGALLTVLLAGAPAPDADDQGLRNGAIPDSLLHTVAGVRLDRDAAEALRALLELAAAEQVPVIVTDGYRTFEAQVDLQRRKPHLAARPGTSMHGWGRAIDVDLARTDMAWFHLHAPRFGWELPPWARPDGSKPEPWHWEYVGAGFATSRPDDAGRPLPGAGGQPSLRLVEVPSGVLLGHLHLGRDTLAAHDGIEIREGVEELNGVVGHYPGSALPGEDGNAALAGYHRDRGAPLAGLETLRPGDPVLVRTMDGEQLVYGLLARRELEAHELWALDADPLGLGIDRTLTITTGTEDHRLLVSWFAPAPPERCPTDPWSPDPCPARRPSAGWQAR